MCEQVLLQDLQVLGGAMGAVEHGHGELRAIGIFREHLLVELQNLLRVAVPAEARVVRALGDVVGVIVARPALFFQDTARVAERRAGRMVWIVLVVVKLEEQVGAQAHDEAGVPGELKDAPRGVVALGEGAVILLPRRLVGEPFGAPRRCRADTDTAMEHRVDRPQRSAPAHRVKTFEARAHVMGQVLLLKQRVDGRREPSHRAARGAVKDDDVDIGASVPRPSWVSL
mmetsp:Transcript_114646/g.309658  ORF Transcript_114646/g.309658 Transcript_114646/m.309658 type:complete len:228 (+) Transcript_114646:1432-2115(+)